MNQDLIKRVDAFVEENRDNIINDIMELARVPSIRSEPKDGAPYGEKCREVLNVGIAIAKRHGFEAAVYSDKYALMYHGAGEKTIGFFGHLDVVPVGDGWTMTEPFNPTVKDGVLYGRGVDDNKAGVISGLYTIKALRDLGVPIKSKLMLFMGSSEETGMDDVKTFAAEQPMPDFSLVPDAGFPVCHGEKGSSQCWVIADKPFVHVKEMSGGSATNVVCGEVKAVVAGTPELKAALKALCDGHEWVSYAEKGDDIELIAKGRSSHASMPQSSHNATYEMVKLLAACGALDQGDRDTCAFATHALDGFYGENVGIAYEDEPSGKLTCANGIVKLTDGRLHYSYDVRYCVTLDGAVVQAGFEKHFAPGTGFSIEKVSYGNGYYVPADDDRIVTLLNIYRTVTGDTEGEPYTMGGGTYARRLQNAVAFGPAPRVPKKKLDLPEGHGGVHQPDEALVIESFLDAVKVYILSAAELDGIVNS